MSTPALVPAGDPAQGTRRLALVMSDHAATTGAPPGVDPAAFAAACLADSYEVLADLVGVTAGIVGAGEEVADLLWPGSLQLLPNPSLKALAEPLTGRYDELVLVPADVPDLPGLVLAKVFKALQHAEVCVAPERGGRGGCVALGLRLPWPSWVVEDLDLDRDLLGELTSRAPSRRAVAAGPDWHRLRSPDSVHRLDPGLEGWELTRSLLSAAAGPGR